MQQIQLGTDKFEIMPNAVALHLGSFQDACQCVRENTAMLARWAVEFDRPETWVFFPGCKKPFRVLASMAQGWGNQHLGRSSSHAPIIRSATDIDFNALYNGSNPIYINALADQSNLFLNVAAINAQSGKPAQEFLKGTAHLLNFEEELETRCNHIISDRSLTEYSYQAMRWFRDGDRWVRRRMQFVSNFWRIQYLGQECWLGEVLSCEATGRSVGDAIGG